MSDQTRKSVSYALDFLGFLFLEKESEKKISAVYLFGSAVRGELDGESDIDIFIDCKSSDEDSVLRLAESARRKFVASKDFDKWKSFNFVYPFSIKAGELGKWQVKTSIMSEGIELYSRSAQQSNAERAVIFSFEFPRNKKLYLKAKRQLFGRKEENYRSEGLAEKKGGQQLSSNVFTVPKSEQNNFMKFFHKNKIKFKMMEVIKAND